MTRPTRYTQGVRERAVQMVLDHGQDYGSQWAAIKSIAEKIGCTAETLRKWVRQAEEHLVLETNRASEFAPGDELLAIPRHICPTSALHRQACVVSNGKVVDRWDVAARDRWLTI